MNSTHHTANEEVGDAIGEKELDALILKHGNHRFSFSGIRRSLVRRKAKQLFLTMSLEEVANEIGKSVKQTERILNS